MTRRHRRNHSLSVSRSPFSTDRKAIQWLFSILTCQTLIRNCFTAALLKRWNKFSECVHWHFTDPPACSYIVFRGARSIQSIRKPESGGSKKRMLLVRSVPAGRLQMWENSLFALRPAFQISVSAYTNGWQTLRGPKTDWRLWAMLGTSE